MTYFAATSIPKGYGANRELIFLIKEIEEKCVCVCVCVCVLDGHRQVELKMMARGWLADRVWTLLGTVALITLLGTFTESLLGTRHYVCIISPNPHNL